MKSFDFLVYPPDGRKWIVDIKGRKYPYESGRQKSRRYWENWVTRADLTGLSAWEDVFLDFEAYFVFSYWILCETDSFPETSVHRFRDRKYVFLAVPLGVYSSKTRERSAKWETVSVPLEDFRTVATSVEQEWGLIAEEPSIR